MKALSFWEAERLTMERSLELTKESLQAYGSLYNHWAIAYSGGKDSTAVVSLVTHLIASGEIAAPKSLTVLYADTRMELPHCMQLRCSCLQDYGNAASRLASFFQHWMIASLSTSLEEGFHHQRIDFGGVPHKSKWSRWSWPCKICASSMAKSS